MRSADVNDDNNKQLYSFIIINILHEKQLGISLPMTCSAPELVLLLELSPKYDTLVKFRYNRDEFDAHKTYKNDP